ncbi:hypothetical protein SRB5_39480 [Streptomyces sp. RB5]|uniref:ABC transporter permease n=1 Tax=Streptomyces smaragdinus TaxID=2585196 RepID=A0A7K0CKM0_9ACTN|nr:ABC transporter permease [Streptomyces smaragdinus]MQY13793.1 hypothetical protein [Streptomyces smaragdinus]
MTNTAAAEWLKLRSVRSTWWFVAGAAVTMLVVAPGTALTTSNNLEMHGGDPGSVDAASAAVGTVAFAVQFVLGALGMLAMTSEFAGRSITVTLACTPVRARLMLAKAGVVAVVVFAVGVPLAAVGTAVSAPLLDEYGRFDAARTVAQVGAMGVHLALVAVLALGVGTLVRRSAGTITVLFGLLLVVPFVLQLLAAAFDSEVFATVAEFTPTLAGQRFMTGDAEYGLVVAAWAAAALAAGIRALRTRDV